MGLADLLVGDGQVIEFFLDSYANKLQLFIIEGILPTICSAYTYFCLPGYPQTVDFLSEDECAAILADLPQQAPTVRAKTFDTDQIKSLFKSATFFPFLMIWTTHGIGGWGIMFVLPTVIYELGISNTAVSQVLTIRLSHLSSLY